MQISALITRIEQNSNNLKCSRKQKQKTLNQHLRRQLTGKGRNC